MAHALTFRCQVVPVLLTDTDDERGAGGHVDTVLRQLGDLFRVVGEQLNIFHDEVLKHSCRDGVIPSIGR